VGQNLLLVEDRDDVATTLGTILAGVGYDVAARVGSVDDALDRLQRARPDGAVVEARVHGQ